MKSLAGIMAATAMMMGGQGMVGSGRPERRSLEREIKKKYCALPKLTVDGPTPKGAEIIPVAIGVKKGRHTFEFRAEILRRSLKSYNKALVKLTHELQDYVDNTSINELLDKKEYEQVITMDDGQGILEK